MNIVQQANPPIGLERTLGMPNGGPKCLPLKLDWTAQTSYTLDYTNMQQRAFLDMCQTLWVDNYNSAQILTIFIPGSQQTLKIPAGAQGYFTCLCPNPIVMEFSVAATAAVVVQVTLMNFPVIG